MVTSFGGPVVKIQRSCEFLKSGIVGWNLRIASSFVQGQCPCVCDIYVQIQCLYISNGRKLIDGLLHFQKSFQSEWLVSSVLQKFQSNCWLPYLHDLLANSFFACRRADRYFCYVQNGIWGTLSPQCGTLKFMKTALCRA